MTVETLERPAVTKPAKAGIIDCDIHPLMGKPGDVQNYLPARWREHHKQFGSHLHAPFVSADPFPKSAPFLSRRDAFPPNGGPPGSDLAFMRAQHLDPFNVELGVLQVLSPSGMSQRNLDYGAAICRAANDWQLAEWTGPEPRLKASLVVPQENPEAAVAEIRRHAGNRDFVQVSVAQRALEPLGRRRYWPIYAAAVEAGLPLGIHSSGNAGHSPLPGGGWPSYYLEQHQLIAMGMQALATSLIMEGVFEEFPTLKVVLIEGGFAWVPAMCWRLDGLWQRLRAEVPHVRRPPSEYVREHFWFSTQPMEEPERHDDLRRTFEWIGFDRLVFSSDYPHWDYDDARYAISIKLTPEERQAVFRDNARTLFGLA